MARLFAEPTYRAFSTTLETPYGAAELVAAAKRMKFEGDPTVSKVESVVTDADEYTGSKFLAEYTPEKMGVDLVHTRRLLPHEFALFASLLLGDVDSAAQGGTEAYKHIIQPDNTTIDLPSVTMWESTPSYGNKKFCGIGCSQIELDWNRGEFCKGAYTLMGDGSCVAGDALSAVALVSDEAYLKYANVDLKIGGTFNGTAVADGVSIKGMMRTGKLTMKNGAEKMYGFGNADGYADGLLKGNLKDLGTMQMDVTYEPADSTYLDYLTAGTEAVIELSIVGGVCHEGYNYTINIIFPRARVIEIPRLGREGSIQVADLKIEALKDVSVNDYPMVYAWVINLVTAYLG